MRTGCQWVLGMLHKMLQESDQIFSNKMFQAMLQKRRNVQATCPHLSEGSAAATIEGNAAETCNQNGEEHRQPVCTYGAGGIATENAEENVAANAVRNAGQMLQEIDSKVAHKSM